MKKMSSRNRILMGAFSMFLYMIGDYLLGINTVGSSPDSTNPYGIVVQYAPDWRFAGSSLMGFIGTIFFAIGATELIKVVESRCQLTNSKLFQMFRIANLSGILYFAFMHNCMSMLPVVYNAGMDATGNEAAAVGMLVRVGMSIIIPLAAVLIIADLGSTISWIGLIITQKIPVKRIFLICNPLVIALLGQILGLLPLPFEGIDSGFESLGWMSMYLVCAFTLTEKNNRK